MIRKQLPAVKAATFCVKLPGGSSGTGFFVSPSGYFVTAAHVVADPSGDGSRPMGDASRIRLIKPVEPTEVPELCMGLTLLYFDPTLDFAILKADVAKHSHMDWFAGRSGFSHLDLSTRSMEEGEPVFSFGYPLTEIVKARDIPGVSAILGPLASGTGARLSPRVTSAVISSRKAFSGPASSVFDPQQYAIDKALNYGNSGGPIVSTESGKAFAICTSFQPVDVQQPHIAGKPRIFMPSLYGIAVSLANPSIVEKLEGFGVTIATD